MRLLLDTHTLLWWIAASSHLSVTALHAIRDSDNYKLVSAASAWEISIKHHSGKLPMAAGIADDLSSIIANQGFEELPITVADAALAGSLPRLHRDPFDRMLIAQALAGGLTLVSNETVFDGYGVQRLW